MILSNIIAKRMFNLIKKINLMYFSILILVANGMLEENCIYFLKWPFT